MNSILYSVYVIEHGNGFVKVKVASSKNFSNSHESFVIAPAVEEVACDLLAKAIAVDEELAYQEMDQKNLELQEGPPEWADEEVAP